jgi:hypothetical protein
MDKTKKTWYYYTLPRYSIYRGKTAFFCLNCAYVIVNQQLTSRQTAFSEKSAFRPLSQLPAACLHSLQAFPLLTIPPTMAIDNPSAVGSPSLLASCLARLVAWSPGRLVARCPLSIMAQPQAVQVIQMIQLLTVLTVLPVLQAASLPVIDKPQAASPTNCQTISLPVYKPYKPYRPTKSKKQTNHRARAHHAAQAQA